MYIIKQNKNKEWILIKKGAKRATRIFQTKLEAEMYAKAKCPDDYEVEEEEKPTNSTPKAQKKIESNEKTYKKKNKKSKVIFTIFFILLLVIIAFLAYLYFNGYLDKIINSNNPDVNDKENNGNNDSNGNSNPTGGNTNPGSSTDTSEGVIYDDFQIHFMELGNDAAGDSIYIKAGDTDILIDAGSTASSATTLINYINKYCTDGKLEYVIATHGHTDHIAAFAGNSDNNAKNYKGDGVDRTGILYYYDVGTFIDFNYTTATKKGASKEETFENKNQKSNDFSPNTLYGKYLAAREYAINQGTVHYTANECFNNINGAKSTYELAPGITMDILYNYYYSNTSNDLNNYSVCTMFNYNDHHFMFTGDLESKGEQELANYYNSSTKDRTLPHVDLFKAGHHGSLTSSNDSLLKKITPDICCVCCCAGTAEYTPAVDNQFPSQEFINRIAKYTDKVYVTSTIKYNEETKKWENTSMNGNITVSCDGNNIGVKASNNLIKLKDTDWFNEIIYVKNGNNVDKKKSTDFYTKETEGVTPRPRRTWPNT